MVLSEVKVCAFIFIVSVDDKELSPFSVNAFKECPFLRILKIKMNGKYPHPPSDG